MEPHPVHLDAGTIEELRQVLGDDLGTLVNTFMADSEMRISVMRRTQAAGDGTGLREAAHSFKGSSMNIGAMRLAELCRQAETLARSGDCSPVAVLLDEIAAEYRLVTGLLPRA